MEKVRNSCKDVIEDMRSKFLTTASTVDAVFGAHAFHRIDANGHFEDRLNRALMDVVMVGFGYHGKDALEERRAAIVELLKELINDDAEFLDAITVRTSTKAKMEYRVHTFVQRLAGAVEG
jgi:hypothetical protein